VRMDNVHVHETEICEPGLLFCIEFTYKDDNEH